MPGSDHSLMEEMLEQYNNDAPARAVYAALVVLFSFTLGTFFGQHKPPSQDELL